LSDTPVDFGRVADTYARYRGGFPDELFKRLAEKAGGRLECLRILDVGCGTGALANEFARRGGEVFGVDPSQELLEQAERAARDEDLQVRYLRGKAESLSLSEASFDLATAARCWHWLDRDRAALELRRVLRPGGFLAICHFDRVSAGQGDLLASTQELIERFNPDWAGSPPRRYGHGAGIYSDWFGDLRRGGFEAVESFSSDFEIPYTHEAWLGRVRSSGGVGGSLGGAEMARFDAALRGLLARDFPQEPVPVVHRLFCVLGRNPEVSGGARPDQARWRLRNSACSATTRSNCGPL